MARRGGIWDSRDDDEEEYEKYERLLRKGKGRRQFSLSFLSRMQKQTIVAVMLLLVVLSAKYGNDPTSGTVYSTFQAALSPKNDYSVALTEAAKGFLSGGGDSVAVDSKHPVLQLPVNGTVVNGFGWQTSSLDHQRKYYTGIDISAALGSPVYAPLGGTVTKVGADPELGRYIKLDHGDGLSSIISNFGEVKVKAQQQVKKGQLLGTLGFTSAVKQPWLHWEVRRNNQPVDPLSPNLNPASKL